MLVQVGLCRTCSETALLVFPRGGSNFRICLFPQVCGSPDIPLNLLKSVATYKGIDVGAPLVQWFWEVMEEFSNAERSLFLRFVWGRTRLPRTIADFRGRDFVLQVRSWDYFFHGKHERQISGGDYLSRVMRKPTLVTEQAQHKPSYTGTDWKLWIEIVEESYYPIHVGKSKALISCAVIVFA